MLEGSCDADLVEKYWVDEECCRGLGAALRRFELKVPPALRRSLVEAVRSEERLFSLSARKLSAKVDWVCNC